ncbi:MAG: DUF1294 domain-containing protein [Saccharofermentans sp.]|nr:DUF1294 domain-containing protein [Saccharofermentans sp.]
MLLVLTGYFIFINVITMAVYGIDKLKAVRGSFRIPEKILIGLMAAGGVFGAIAGMLLFRHKIRKPKFIICSFVFTVLYLALFAFIAYKHLI